MNTSTLDQRRSRYVFEHIAAIKGESYDLDYGRLALGAPTLIRRAGLMQALAFYEAKGGVGCDAGPDRPQKQQYGVLLGHWLSELKDLERVPAGVDSLRSHAEGLDLVPYMLLTRELLALAQWHRRFAQSVLKVEPGDDAE